jgi:hypothetical protein
MPAANTLQPDLARADLGGGAVNDEAAAQPQAACQPRKHPWLAGPPLASARVQLAATASRSGIALRAYDNVEEISTEWRGCRRAQLAVSLPYSRSSSSSYADDPVITERPVWDALP